MFLLDIFFPINLLQLPGFLSFLTQYKNQTWAGENAYTLHSHFLKTFIIIKWKFKLQTLPFQTGRKKKRKENRKGRKEGPSLKCQRIRFNKTLMLFFLSLTTVKKQKFDQIHVKIWLAFLGKSGTRQHPI